MKYSDINFTEHSWHYGTSLGFPVRGYWVTKDLFDLMWRKANREIPKLDWSKQQTVVTIFGGKDEWQQLSFGQRIALGRCLKYFADQGMLPIRVANPGKKGTRKYAHLYKH